MSSDLRFSSKEELDNFIYSTRAHFGNTLAGVDECGRGSVAGPLVVGCVVLPPDHGIVGIKDSKQLSPKRREDLALQIHAVARCGIGVCEAAEVDTLGPRGAVGKAALDAISLCSQKGPINVVMCDGSIELDTDLVYYSIIDGDEWVESISAASIIAKAYHDKQMEIYDEIWPEYHFSSCHGYGTKKHNEAIKAYGLTPQHRKSYGICRDYTMRDADGEKSEA